MNRATRARPAHRYLPARTLPLVVLGATLLALTFPASRPIFNTRPAHAAGLPGVHVSGNQLVDANGTVVRLHGVDYSGTEFACIQGYGIFDGTTPTQAYVTNLLAAHVNAVRIPLNEDCWLGINGVNPAYGGATYQTAIDTWASLLIANNIFPILDLHWNAPGSTQATGQQPMPDADHSPAFWQSVATRFAGRNQILFDLYNEPYPSSWSCWRDGGAACTGDVPYAVAGMQTLVNTVRAAGATNVILLGCLGYSNTCNGGGYSGSWWQDKPSDPANNLAASVHVYLGNGCVTTACWSANWLPIIQQGNPIIDGEWGAYDYNGANYNESFGTTFLDWMDANGASGYVAWTWNNWNTWSPSAAEPLIQADDGSVLSTWGKFVQSQYGQRFPAGSPTPTSTPTGPTNTPVPGTPTATPNPPTATSTSTPVPATPTTAPLRLTVSFSGTFALPISVLPKRNETLSGSLQFNQAMSAVTVTYLVVNALGYTVYSYSWTGQTFSANTARSYSVNWKVPRAEPLGIYTFRISVTNGGGIVYGMDNSAGRFSVV